MKKQLFTLLLTLSLSYAGFSGVTYFQYDDSFALTRSKHCMAVREPLCQSEN